MVGFLIKECLILALFSALISIGDAFKQIAMKPISVVKQVQPINTALYATDSTSFSMLTSILQRVDPSAAAVEFYFFFFAGSGALGLGFKQVPFLLAESARVKSMANGVTKGGPDLDVFPLATIGYPEPLKVADVEEIIKLCPTVQEVPTLQS